MFKKCSPIWSSPDLGFKTKHLDCELNSLPPHHWAKNYIFMYSNSMTAHDCLAAFSLAVWERGWEVSISHQRYNRGRLFVIMSHPFLTSAALLKDFYALLMKIIWIWSECTALWGGWKCARVSCGQPHPGKQTQERLWIHGHIVEILAYFDFVYIFFNWSMFYTSSACFRLALSPAPYRS